MYAAPLAGILLAGVSMVVVHSSSSASLECDAFKGTIEESRDYTAYEAQLDHLPDPLLNPSGDETPTVPIDLSVPSINGMPRQWAFIGSDGAAYQYYLDQPIGRDMTLAQFRDAGGIELDASPADSKQTFAAYLQEAFGDRAVPIAIRDTTGVVVWADPESSDGLRLHQVYWDHNGYTFGLLVDETPELSVTSARQVACALP
jgi:hypothetical protein